jgi:hypothetical protein
MVHGCDCLISRWIYILEGAKTMSGSEDVEFRHAFKHWAEQVENHQYQIFLETAKLVELLKQKKVSAKTKNEIIIVLKGLQATVKSVSKVLKKYTQ